MIIIIAATILDNEKINIFQKNIEILKNTGHKIISIANTNHQLETSCIIKKVSTMKNSRDSLHEAAYKYNGDIYFILDSDILLPENVVDKVLEYKKDYDFVSMYYEIDPPIPTFYTLSSSLNDFYNYKKGFFSLNEKPTFDDTDFNNSFYSSINSYRINKDISEILYGKSFARDIDKFTDVVDKDDSTTGGASIYFNKEALKIKCHWEEYKGKSLTWYDSYRTRELMKTFKFSKIPIFVKHLRNMKNIKLCWDSVISYINGYNLYMFKTKKEWNQEALILHTKELFFFIKGMIKKIDSINLSKNEKNVIENIRNFMNLDIFELLEENIVIWE